MSWDVILLKVLSHIKAVEDIPSDLPPIGTRVEIVSQLSEEFPDHDFSHTGSGFIRGDGWSIEVYFAGEKLIRSLHLGVRGTAAVLNAVAAILKRLHLRGIDVQNTSLFDSEEGMLASFQLWCDFRDQALAKSTREKS